MSEYDKIILLTIVYFGPSYFLLDACMCSIHIHTHIHDGWPLVFEDTCLLGKQANTVCFVVTQHP